jgi:hypothetical protein
MSSYRIITQFQSDLPITKLVAKLQDLYDTNGVDGTYDIAAADTEKRITFVRDASADVGYVVDRLPTDHATATPDEYRAAAVAQLIEELTEYDPDDDLLPIIAALSSAAVVEGVEELRAEMPIAKMSDGEIERLQARIDALMLEYCPDEMTPEQIANWERHQKAAPNAVEKMLEKQTAKEQFDELGGAAEPDPLERLRFYCSLAMTGQAWLDVEPFFDDVQAMKVPNA